MTIKLCYTDRVETNRYRGVLLLNAVDSTQYLLWAKRPLLGGFASRCSSRQRRQPSRGRFVMSKILNTESTKTCYRCEQEKSITEFGPNKRSKDGLKYHCRECDAKEKQEVYRERPSAAERARDRARNYRADPIKREQMAVKRRGNPKYLAQRRQYLRNLKEKHFFIYRARRWSSFYNGRVTGLELFHLWHMQKGKCALSGRKLGRDSHLDHILPTSKGGTDTIDNLRWLDRRVNIARGAMMDEDFTEMCRDVTEYNVRK